MQTCSFIRSTFTLMENAKKRSWGKTKHRGKRPLSESEDDPTLGPLSEPIKRIKTFEEPDSFTQIDLQHPELMSNDILVKALGNMKVPVPIYPDGTPSRERLIYLFKKHVTPRPQRARITKPRRKNSNKYIHIATNTVSAHMMKANNASSISWSTTEKILSPTGKRNLEGADVESSPSKRSSISVLCSPFSKTSMNGSTTSTTGTENTTGTHSPLTNLGNPLSVTDRKHVLKPIKLRRPV